MGSRDTRKYEPASLDTVALRLKLDGVEQVNSLLKMRIRVLEDAYEIALECIAKREAEADAALHAAGDLVKQPQPERDGDQP